MPSISPAQEKKLLECKYCWPMHSKQDIAALRKDPQPWSVYGANDFDEYLQTLKKMYKLQRGALYATAGIAGSKFLYDLYNYAKPNQGLALKVGPIPSPQEALHGLEVARVPELVGPDVAPRRARELLQPSQSRRKRRRRKRRSSRRSRRSSRKRY